MRLDNGVLAELVRGQYPFLNLVCWKHFFKKYKIWDYSGKMEILSTHICCVGELRLPVSNFFNAGMHLCQ